MASVLCAQPPRPEEGVCIHISLTGTERCPQGKYLREQNNPMLLGCSETPGTGAEGAQHRWTDRAA